MKPYHCRCSQLFVCFIFVTLVTMPNGRQCLAEVIPPPPEVTVDEVIASTHATELRPFEEVLLRFEGQNQRLVGELLKLVKEPGSSNLTRCFAVYYLGVVRDPEAVDGLANKISLTMDYSGLLINMLPPITEHPAMDALIKIGCPSIRAVIRNLGDSDDALVRELSLKVLYKIESDKEIATIRLQRALDAQRDPQKKARLQSALKSLVEMQK